MSLLVVYIVLVFIGQAFAVTIGILVDAVSQPLGLAVFLALYFSVFIVGWKVAVRLTAPGGIIHARLGR